jgi:hypothetical protein
MARDDGIQMHGEVVETCPLQLSGSNRKTDTSFWVIFQEKCECTSSAFFLKTR